MLNYLQTGPNVLIENPFHLVSQHVKSPFYLSQKNYSYKIIIYHLQYRQLYTFSLPYNHANKFFIP